jgi:hypothetical protein
MTRAKWRIHPFHQKTARPMRNVLCLLSDGLYALGQTRDQSTGAVRHAAGSRHTSDITEYAGETCRLEVHYLWWTWQSRGEPCNRPVTYGADIAQFLGENYIRSQLTQKSLVDCVNCSIITQCAAHPLVDFATRQAGTVYRTMSDPWPLIRFFREITFMRNTDYLVHQSKRSCNLGGSGQKRNDPAHCVFYLFSRDQNRTEERTLPQGAPSRIPTIPRILSLCDALQNTDCLRD